MPTAFVSANGLQIGYDVHGAGPPMVLLHGAGSAGREDYAAQVPLFAKAFRVHLPDARGHATSRWDSADGVTADDLVADLLGFVDALQLRSFHLVGFSLGATTALRFAVRYPERLRTLVSIGIVPDLEPRRSVARRLLDPERIEREDTRWAAELHRRHDATQGPGAWQRLLAAIIDDVATAPLLTPGDLRRIELPAMVVVGDRDPFTPVGQAWELARQLPDARLFVAPGCGHDVMVRRPALFNEAMGAFYRSTEAKATERAIAAGSLAHPSAARRGTDGEWLAHAADHGPAHAHNGGPNTGPKAHPTKEADA